jgi:hypothetical protein
MLKLENICTIINHFKPEVKIAKQTLAKFTSNEGNKLVVVSNHVDFHVIQTKI